MLIGLRLLDCTGLKVIGCGFLLEWVSGIRNFGAGYFGAGIFANGNCTGLSVRQTTFTGLRKGFFVPIGPIFAPSFETERDVAPAPANAVASDDATKPSTTGSKAKKAAKKAVVTPRAASAVTGAGSATSKIAPSARFSLLNDVRQKITAALNIPVAQQGLNVIPVILTLPPPPIMLTAFLMAPSIDPTFNYTEVDSDFQLIGGYGENEATLFAQAALNQAEFVDNQLQGLSVAMLGTAVAGTVTIRDNTITDCIGGIWFGSQAQDNVGDAGFFQWLLASDVPQGSNAGSAMAIAMWYPLPQASSSTANLQTLPPQFHVVNNRIDAIPLDGSVSGPACYVWIFPPQQGSGMYTSFLLNSNQIRNSSDPTSSNATGATVYFSDAIDTIVDANLIRNIANPAASSPPTVIYSLVAPGAVASGNLLVGTSVTQ